VSHGAVGIELSGPLECADRFVVVVGVHECEPLLEVLLRLGARCRHRPPVLTEARVLDNLGRALPFSRFAKYRAAANFDCRLNSDQYDEVPESHDATSEVFVSKSCG